MLRTVASGRPLCHNASGRLKPILYGIWLRWQHIEFLTSNAPQAIYTSKLHSTNFPNTAPKHPQLHTRNRCGGPRITTEIKPMETGLRKSKEPQDPIPLGLGQTPSRRRTQQTTRNCAPGQFHAHRRDPTGENLLDEYRQQFPWIS